MTLFASLSDHSNLNWPFDFSELDISIFKHSFAGGHVGSSYLYFGCRSRVQDYYYKDLWEQLLQKGILSPDNGLQVAFSREHGRKVYVQEILARNSAQLYNLICEVINLLLHEISCTKLVEQICQLHFGFIHIIDHRLSTDNQGRAF